MEILTFAPGTSADEKNNLTSFKFAMALDQGVRERE